MNILTLLDEAYQFNPDLDKDLARLMSSGRRERGELIRTIEETRGLKASSSLRNLIQEFERRGHTGKDVDLLCSLKQDIIQKREMDKPLPVFTIPPGLRGSIPSAVASEHLTTVQAIDHLFSVLEKRMILVSAFTSMGVIDILGPHISQATRSGKDVILITQPPSRDYDPRGMIDKLRQIVETNGDGSRLSIRMIDMEAEGMMHLKIIISDNNAALVGSANLTKGALAHNIEAGVLVFGHTARIICNTIEALIQK
jgi:HKD family nuclease